MDYYKILELSNNATKQEIRGAYKNLAKKYHPDKNNNSDYFAQINNAYHILINDDTRKNYDKSINNNFPHEILLDLFNDFSKLIKLIKPITSFNIITNITDLYLGKKNTIFYYDITINYYPIKSLEITFEDEILKIESILVDNINYELDNYDVSMKISLSQLPEESYNSGIYNYDLILPDQSVLNISIDEEEVDDVLTICYKKRGLPKLSIYNLGENYIVNENIVKRGNLYLIVSK